jgi:transcriptional regulator with XRE-family HTH domain
MRSSAYNIAMITPAQSSAARGLIDWSQSQLAAQSRLGLSAIRSFESGKRTPISNNLDAIHSAFEQAGVVFLHSGQLADGGEGVRLRRQGAPDDILQLGDDRTRDDSTGD